jgi:hypothetical protein
MLHSKWNQQNQQHKHLINEEQNLKNVLSQNYQVQMQMQQKAKLTEAEMKLLNEKEMLERNRKQMEREKHLQDEKRKDYTRARLDDLKLKKQKQEFDHLLRERDVEESKQLMSDYTRKEIQREENYRNMYKNINNNMERNLNQYSEHVLKSNLQRQISEEAKRQEDIKRYNQKLENGYRNQVAQREAQKQEMTNTIHMQVKEKQHQGHLNNQIFGLESQKMRERVSETKEVDNYLKDEKRKRQLLYREMLANQIHFKDQIKMHGNMTAVEKQLNKLDLKAYQNNDKNVYSFVPGINHDNLGTKTNFYQKKDKKEDTEYERERVRRLEAFGFNRGFNASGHIQNSRAGTRHKNNKSMSIIPGDEGFDNDLTGNAVKTFDNSAGKPSHNRRISETPKIDPYGSPYQSRLGKHKNVNF